MTEPTYGRLLAIKAAAAGPYRILGRCADCGEEEGVVAFPRPFSTSIAICRRCRFNRTGVEDRRGLVRATATISRPEGEVDGTTTCAPSGRFLDAVEEIRPDNPFARAVVAEADRSPSFDDREAGMTTSTTSNGTKARRPHRFGS